MTFTALLCLLAALAVVTTAQEQAPPPPFLQGASPAVVEEFHKMLQTSNGKTDKQIDDAVDEWISKQDDGIKSIYFVYSNRTPPPLVTKFGCQSFFLAQPLYNSGLTSYKKFNSTRKYETFKAQMKEHHQAADAAHKEAISKFSPEAKAADEKLSGVATNPSLTAEQKGKEIEKIVNGLPAGVRAEIEKAMQG